jgi:CelD/BcsL family acetyltransferase involved in cellulose biosynthesis
MVPSQPDMSRGGQGTSRAGLRGEFVAPDAMDALVDEWRALAEAQGNAFLTPEWFTAWYRRYGRRASPVLVAVRDSEDGLAGLLPLARVGRTIQFAGANVGDWFGPLARTGLELEVATVAAQTLSRAGHRTLVLHNVDQDAEWISALAKAWPGSLRRHPLQSSVIPYVPLAATWEDFLATRSRNFRSQIGRKERNLRRLHDVDFCLANDPAGFPAAMETFFRLHHARWNDDRHSSSLTSENAQAHHADFAAMALGRGWLRLWFLMVDGREVAAWYGWRIGHRYCYFNAGWDPAWSHASVGLVLLAHTVRSAIGEGATEYNLLLGDEPYKARFATARLPIETVVLAPPASPGQLIIHVNMGIRRLARVLPPSLRARLRSAVAPVTDHLLGARPR